MQHLNYTQGLILFGIPLEDRDQFIADNDVGDMSQRELWQTINESGRAPQEEDFQEPENQGTQKQEKAEEAADRQYAQRLRGATKNSLDLNRVDPVKKEANRKEALKIATNMVGTLTKCPTGIKTNLHIKKDSP